MTIKITQEALGAVHDCLSFFYGVTVADVSEESTVPRNIVQRILDDGIERGTIERRGNKYRIENAAPWQDGPGPTPPPNVYPQQEKRKTMQKKHRPEFNAPDNLVAVVTDDGVTYCRAHLSDEIKKDLMSDDPSSTVVLSTDGWKQEVGTCKTCGVFIGALDP